MLLLVMVPVTASANVAITTTSLPNGTVGSAYAATIDTKGGCDPMRWTVSGLPAGIISTPTNKTAYLALSGTPTTAGTYRPAISVKGCHGIVSSKQYSVTIEPAPVQVAAPVISSASTASGTVGSAFSYQITATNTPTSYGATGLPAGLSVNSGNGLISGTPTTAATSTVTLSASNSGGTGSASLTLTIAAAPIPAPVITSATTASGTVGSAFSYQITATNSPTSYGATGLPAGLSVNSGNGLISGTPTTAATSRVTLSATNSGGTGNATLTLTINPATSSNCTSPTAVGPYTSCGQAFNDVTSSTTSSVTYSPYAGNGVEVFALYCANSNCNAAPTQTVTSIGDNVNSTETCFTQAPHSPYAFANTNVPDYETIYAWYCPSIPAGVTSFTVTTSAAASYLSLAVIEWEAGTIASTGYFETVDNLNTAGDVAGTTATVSTNGPTTHSNDLITAMLVVCGANGSSPIDAVVGTGYTGITVNPSLDLGLVTEAKSVTSGTQTATTTWSTGTAEGNCALGAGGSNSTWYGVIVPLVGASQAPPVPVAAGQLTASPASLAFGSAQVGNSLTLTDSLTNTGGSAVTISQVTATGTGFSISGLTVPLTLNPGASVTFSAVFAPKSAVSVSGGITVVSNASNSTLTVSLSGTGTAPGQLTLAPTAFNFGNATVGTSVSQTSSLSAAGASVTVSSASLSTAEFSLTGISLPATIAAGQSVPVTVTFTPQSSGSASGVLTVAGSASNTATQNLSGVGVAATQHSVSLSWTDTNSGIAGYNVYRGNASGGPFTEINSGLDTTTAYSDTSVAAGQTYYYVTTAVNASGAESAYSNEVEAVVPSP